MLPQRSSRAVRLAARSVFVRGGFVFAAALSGSGCAAPPVQTKTVSSAARITSPDPKEMLRRETTAALKRYPVRAFDGAIESEVEAFAQPTLSVTTQANGIDIAILTIPLDANASAHCALRAIDGDVGPALARTLKRTLDDESDSRMLSHGAEVVYVRDTPILAAREIVSVTRQGEVRTLDYSVAGTSRDGYSMLCDVGVGGYAQTFLRVTSRFAAAMVVTGASPHRGVEVWDEQTPSSVGYCRNTFATRSNTGERFRSCQSLEFDPEKGWQGGTFQQTNTADKSGAILSEHIWLKHDPMAATTIDLTRTTARTYTYTIDSGGRNETGHFSTSTSVRRESSFGSEFRDVIRGKKARFTFESFGAPPTKGSSVVVTRNSDETLLLAHDDRREECVVDDQGRCTKRTALTLEGVTQWVSSRVFVREPQ